MRRLSIFRHAKSDRGAPRMQDIDRPLNDRGRADAPLMGAFFAENEVIPELVLCSSSVRTQQTAELALSMLPEDRRPKMGIEAVFYLASARTLLARIRKLPAAVNHVMIIGHNPGLQMLAIDLIHDGDPNSIAAIKGKLPTAALVHIAFAVTDWSAVNSDMGHLDRLVTPKMLRSVGTDKDTGHQ